jgi:hypothetical protein
VLHTVRVKSRKVFRDPNFASSAYNGTDNVCSSMPRSPVHSCLLRSSSEIHDDRRDTPQHEASPQRHPHVRPASFLTSPLYHCPSCNRKSDPATYWIVAIDPQFAAFANGPLSALVRSRICLTSGGVESLPKVTDKNAGPIQFWLDVCSAHQLMVCAC